MSENVDRSLLSNSISGDQLGRWAELIAEGRAEFPADLLLPDHGRLEGIVRRRLRDRLVRWIARGVAARIRATGALLKENPDERKL